MAPLFLDLDHILRLHRSLSQDWGVAAGRAGKEEIAEFFRSRAGRPRPPRR